MIQKFKWLQYLLYEDKTHFVEFGLQGLRLVPSQSVKCLQALHFLYPVCLHDMAQITLIHLQFKILLQMFLSLKVKYI